mmetsp:Transcript_20544/g.56999  ORF Transcript_20544/g.56999 Transcript_20544/m.56999 type:complete len:244 (-) Transcript_20544:587-1318(-)
MDANFKLLWFPSPSLLFFTQHKKELQYTFHKKIKLDIFVRSTLSRDLWHRLRVAVLVRSVACLLARSVVTNELSKERLGLGRKTEEDPASEVREAGEQIVGRPLTPLAILRRRNAIGNEGSPDVRHRVVSQLVLELPAVVHEVQQVDAQTAGPGSHKGESLQASRARDLAQQPLKEDHDQGHRAAEHGQHQRRPGRGDESIVVGKGFFQVALAVGSVVPDAIVDRRSARAEEIARIHVEDLHS